MTRVCALPHYWLRHPNASSGRRHAAHLACHTLNPSERPVLAVLCTTQTFIARVSRQFCGWVPVGTPVHPAGLCGTTVKPAGRASYFKGLIECSTTPCRRVGSFPITAASRFEETQSRPETSIPGTSLLCVAAHRPPLVSAIRWSYPPRREDWLA